MVSRAKNLREENETSTGETNLRKYDKNAARERKGRQGGRKSHKHREKRAEWWVVRVRAEAAARE